MHLCSNETIGGIETLDWPDMQTLGAPDVPLVIDASTYAWTALVVLGAATISALVVRRRLDRLDLVAVLKTRE